MRLRFVALVLGLTAAALISGTAAGGSPSVATTSGVTPSGKVAHLAVDGRGRSVVALPAPKGAKPWVLRVDAAGAVDDGFGDGGVLRPSVEGPSVEIAVRRDGAVLVAGMHGYETVLRRFLPSGKLDRAFGEGGAVHLRHVAVERVMQQAKGGIVLLGTRTCPPSSCGYLYRNLQVLHLTGKGRVTRHLNVSHEAWNLVTAGIGRTGSVVAIGFDWELEYLTFEGFLSNGRGDRNLDKRIDYEDEPIGGISDVAVLPDRRFVVATEVGLWGRRVNGAPDRSFGDGGRVVCGGPIPDPETFASLPFGFVAVVPGGKIVAAGGGGQCGLVRYLADGRLDPGFAGDGMVDLGAEGVAAPLAVAVNADASTVLAGWDTASRGLKLARFAPSGELDATFGSGGQATLSPWAPL